MRYVMPGLLKIGLLSSCLLLNLSACQLSPSPRTDCTIEETLLLEYADKYFDALEDVGNLRQQLKAAEERRGL